MMLTKKSSIFGLSHSEKDLHLAVIVILIDIKSCENMSAYFINGVVCCFEWIVSNMDHFDSFIQLVQ